MKSQKSAIAPSTTSVKILDEMAEIEREYQKRRDEKRSDLETVRQDLIAKLRQVDAYLGTSSFGVKPGSKEDGEKSARLRKGELERYIKEALAKGPAPVGELLRRIHDNGLVGKDGSIRSKVGNPKWIHANGIVKNGDAFSLKR